ncbi:hypothetical protein [Streptomyces inhibens]|uniref:hypothetical protein n=1 Tax=Streptomyces inhibens TaxID=2293571 RepID=UPI001EE76CE1|nr:hypothetical protein [Streptomyces inhibens]UKY50312.1 hypothetical protein KI385_16795 [Streptomyces inhibens]
MSEEVARSIALAEQLTDAEPGQLLSGKFQGFESRGAMSWLRQWVASPAGIRHGLEPIPDDPVHPRRLRRALSLEMAARPGGLFATKVHFKHLQVATSGSSPVVLPAPLAGLVRDLVATRRGKAKIGTPDDVPWLFPGGHPGRPLTDSQIGKRLHSIGIRPKQDRSTALFTLATELPAAILARMLGVHIKVAVQWQKASAGDWAACAADVSRRSEHREGASSWRGRGLSPAVARYLRKQRAPASTRGVIWLEVVA